MNEIKELSNKSIEKMIYEIRGKQVMLDSDVSMLFGYETKYLNRQVQRNIKRFPENYCFQLTKDEYKNLKCQFGTSNIKNTYGGRRTMPYVFTEYGITMLAGILKSEVAIEMSLRIVDTFISMRKYISNNLIEQRYINNQVLKNTEDIKMLQESFNKLDSKKTVNEIYFNGQIYDAYSKILSIIKESLEELIIIDNYADITILDMISKINIPVILITTKNNYLTKLDIEKYNSQYNNLKIIYNDTFHDRYLILDKKIIYHMGSSINHAGSKTFSINKLEDIIVITSLIEKINQIKA
ncbi:MAG: ORF6N domain-containing protein [Bacilli bacterium]|nr:ORF6N domain-containing protein [Bacilli bacterium]